VGVAATPCGAAHTPGSKRWRGDLCHGLLQLAAAREGKCWEAVEKDMKLPKYESWPGYEQGLPFVLRRYSGLWGRGT
jgi:hypothetical protein